MGGRLGTLAAMSDLEPLSFSPILVPKPWGGRRLAEFGKSLPSDGLFGVQSMIGYPFACRFRIVPSSTVVSMLNRSGRIHLRIARRQKSKRALERFFSELSV